MVQTARHYVSDRHREDSIFVSNFDTTTQYRHIDHPMEDLLDITPGSTVVEYEQVLPDTVAHEQYDDKDGEIDDKLETIYATAMSAVASTVDAIETVEGKFKARMSEVTATMLSVALNAIKEKSTIKQHKDKLRSAPTTTGPHTVNNTLVTTSFSDLVKTIKNQS